MPVKILLATSYHEHLHALAGFHLNWRAALSGRMVTMAHLSATTRFQMLTDLAEQTLFPSGDGLIINPLSVQTRFGSALPMLICNYASATRMSLGTTHVYLASPYLYALEPALDTMIEQFDCGLPATIYDLNESWHWYAVAAADARLHDLADYLGTDLQIGRADGVFMTNALFDEMLKILYKFFSPAEIAELEPVYPLEEVLFPTVLPALLGLNARFCSTRARVWDVNDPPNVATMRAAIESGLHAAGKRVPQTPGHPVRQAVLDHLPGHLALNACLGTTIA